MIRFFQNDVPLAFTSVKDAETSRRIQAAYSRRDSALAGLRNISEDDLLPRSNGDFRTGPNITRRSFCTRRWSTFRSTVCCRSAMPTCARIRKKFQRVAALSIAQNAATGAGRFGEGPSAARPVAGRLSSTSHGPARLITAHKIVRFPRKCAASRRDASVYARALRSPLWTRPVHMKWSPRKRSSTSRCRKKTGPRSAWKISCGAFNRGTILSTAIHEAYPGHYVQFLWLQQVRLTRSQTTGRQYVRRRVGRTIANR